MILSTYPFNALVDEGQAKKNGQITKLGAANGVIKVCPATKPPFPAECGWYAYLQGTSMASPHATGVAALAVSAVRRRAPTPTTSVLAPDTVRTRAHGLGARPRLPGAGGVQTTSTRAAPRSSPRRASGTPDFNAFYGDGIVDAYGAVTATGLGPRGPCLAARQRQPAR